MKMFFCSLLAFFFIVADTSATTLPRGSRAVKDAILKQVYDWKLSVFEGNPDEHWTNWHKIAFTGKPFTYGSDLELSIDQELRKLIESKRSVMVQGKTYFARYSSNDKEAVGMTDDYSPPIVWGESTQFEVRVDFFKYFLPIYWPEAKWVEVFSEGIIENPTQWWATANGAPPYCWLSKLTNGFLYLPCDMLAYGGRFIVYDNNLNVLADVTSGPELSIQPASLETSRATKSLRASSSGGYGVKIASKSLPGRFLSLEWSPDLLNWQELTKLVADRDGLAETYDSPPESSGFYRVRVISTAP